MFQHPSRALATPYIHALAPLMVEKLKAVERSRPGSAGELQAVQEGIRVLENLVGMGEEQNRKCTPMGNSRLLFKVEIFPITLLPPRFRFLNLSIGRYRVYSIPIQRLPL